MMHRIAALAATGLALACAEPNGVPGPQLADVAQPGIRQEVRPCGNRNDFFTALPSPLAGIRGIVPLGSLNPGHAHTLPKAHMHAYIVLSNPADPASAPIEVPLYAPSRMTVVAVEQVAPTQYTMQLKSCAEVTFAFDHIGALAPALAAQIGDFSTGVCLDGTCVKRTHIEVAAGEQVGTAGVESLAWDLDLVDLRRGPLPYANPVRYELTEDLLNMFPPELGPLATLIAPQRLHEFCPLDYFVPPLRNALYSFLGSYDGSVRRTAEPRCRVHMQDRVGTSQGTISCCWRQSLRAQGPPIGFASNGSRPRRAAAPGRGPSAATR